MTTFVNFSPKNFSEFFFVEVDKESTPQLPRITYMHTPVTEERSQKIMEARIPRSIEETFLMSKKEIVINQKEVVNYNEGSILIKGDPNS